MLPRFMAVVLGAAIGGVAGAVGVAAVASVPWLIYCLFLVIGAYVGAPAGAVGGAVAGWGVGRPGGAGVGRSAAVAAVSVAAFFSWGVSGGRFPFSTEHRAVLWVGGFAVAYGAAGGAIGGWAARHALTTGELADWVDSLGEWTAREVAGRAAAALAGGAAGAFLGSISLGAAAVALAGKDADTFLRYGLVGLACGGLGGAAGGAVGGLRYDTTDRITVVVGGAAGCLAPVAYDLVVALALSLIARRPVAGSPWLLVPPSGQADTVFVALTTGGMIGVPAARGALRAFPNGKGLTPAAVGGVLGAAAGGAALAVLLAPVCAAVAVAAGLGVAKGATFGAIVGGVFGAAGGAIGGGYRGATGRPTWLGFPVTLAAATAAVLVLLVWGSLRERGVTLVVALFSLGGGVALGDRVARPVVSTIDRPSRASPRRTGSTTSSDRNAPAPPVDSDLGMPRRLSRQSRRGRRPAAVTSNATRVSFRPNRTRSWVMQRNDADIQAHQTAAWAIPVGMSGVQSRCALADGRPNQPDGGLGKPAKGCV